jgi:hypothetical protein
MPCPSCGHRRSGPRWRRRHSQGGAEDRPRRAGTTAPTGSSGQASHRPRSRSAGHAGAPCQAGGRPSLSPTESTCRRPQSPSTSTTLTTARRSSRSSSIRYATTSSGTPCCRCSRSFEVTRAEREDDVDDAVEQQQPPGDGAEHQEGLTGPHHPRPRDGWARVAARADHMGRRPMPAPDSRHGRLTPGRPEASRGAATTVRGATVRRRPPLCLGASGHRGGPAGREVPVGRGFADLHAEDEEEQGHEPLVDPVAQGAAQGVPADQAARQEVALANALPTAIRPHVSQCAPGGTG